MAANPALVYARFPVNADFVITADAELMTPSTRSSTADEDVSADRDVHNRRILDAMVKPAMGDTRTPIHQQHNRVRPTGEVFEHVSARYHDGNQLARRAAAAEC